MQHGNGRDHGGEDRPSGFPGGAPRPRRPIQRIDDPDATQVIGGDGRVLGGRYRLAGLLGASRTSEVHRATDLRLGRPVAVKLFHLGVDRDSARRFTDETHTLATLSHPGLVPVYDSGIDGDQPYLVMELVSGWTLREVTQQERLPLEEISRIGVALADALGYAHQQGFQHGDLKPSNVVIGRDNRVRLTDFGGARPRGRVRPGFESPTYLSPEHVRGDRVGPAADVYSLGLVLLELVTGHVEFPGEGRAAIEARLNRSPEVPAELPENLRGALLAMTDPDPSARPTAPEAASMLAHEPAPAPVPLAGPEPPARNATRQILVIAVGALLLAALIGFVALATGRDSSTSAQPSGTSSATGAPGTTRRTTSEPTTEPTTGTTNGPTRALPKLPTSEISLPSIPNIKAPDIKTPDITLPKAPELSGSVMDQVKSAWQKFRNWLSTLF